MLSNIRLTADLEIRNTIHSEQSIVSIYSMHEWAIGFRRLFKIADIFFCKIQMKQFKGQYKTFIIVRENT